MNKKSSFYIVVKDNQVVASCSADSAVEAVRVFEMIPEAAGGRPFVALAKTPLIEPSPNGSIPVGASKPINFTRQ